MAWCIKVVCFLAICSLLPGCTAWPQPPAMHGGYGGYAYAPQQIPPAMYGGYSNNEYAPQQNPLMVNNAYNAGDYFQPQNTASTYPPTPMAQPQSPANPAAVAANSPSAAANRAQPSQSSGAPAGTPIAQNTGGGAARVPASATTPPPLAVSKPVRPKFLNVPSVILGFRPDFARHKLFVLSTTNADADGLYIINTANGATEKTITSVRGDGPAGTQLSVGADGQYVYLSAGGPNVVAVNTRSNEMRLIKIPTKKSYTATILGCGPLRRRLYMVVSPGAYSANDSTGYMAAIDTRDNKLIFCTPLPPDDGISLTTDQIFLEPARIYMGWQSIGAETTAFIFSGRTGKMVSTISDGEDFHISPGGRGVVVEADGYQQIDPKTGKSLATYSYCWGNILFSPHGRLLYVPYQMPGPAPGNAGQRSLAVIRTATQKILNLIPLTCNPDKASRCYLVPGGHQILIATPENIWFNKHLSKRDGGRGISIIDIARGQCEYTIEMSNPTIVRFSPNGRFAYVINKTYQPYTNAQYEGRNDLADIDLRTGKIVFKTPLPSIMPLSYDHSNGLLVSPGGGRIILSYKNFDQHPCIAVVDAKTGQIIRSLARLDALHQRISSGQPPHYQTYYFSRSGRTLYCDKYSRSIEEDDGIVAVNVRTGQIVKTFTLPEIRVKVPPPKPKSKQNNDDDDSGGFFGF